MSKEGKTQNGKEKESKSSNVKKGKSEDLVKKRSQEISQNNDKNEKEGKSPTGNYGTYLKDRKLKKKGRNPK